MVNKDHDARGRIGERDACPDGGPCGAGCGMSAATGAQPEAGGLCLRSPGKSADEAHLASAVREDSVDFGILLQSCCHIAVDGVCVGTARTWEEAMKGNTDKPALTRICACLFFGGIKKSSVIHGLF
jgi:hypothetical protein